MAQLSPAESRGLEHFDILYMNKIKEVVLVVSYCKLDCTFRMFLFPHVYPTFGLLFNFVLCFNTVDGATDNLLFRQCSQPEAFQYFQMHEAYYCILYCTVYGSVTGWQNQQTAGEKRENMAQNLVHNFHPISATLSAHLDRIWHK